MTEGIEADYVFMIGTSASNGGAFATCKHCAQLKLSNRPIWGGLVWQLGSIANKFQNGLNQR